MNSRICFFAALVFLALLTPLAPAAELADSDCYTCHKELRGSFASGTVHSPVADGDCGSCHEDHGTENSLVLTEEVPQLCLGCHDELTESHKHEPAGDGSCLDCHSVHNSANETLLTEAIPNLCYDCHDPFGDRKSVHKPVAKGECLSCHAAHQSSQEALLVKEQPDLCADCHENADRSKGKFPHEPVAGGECSECHLSHVSDEAPLLAARYNIQRYAPYAEQEYSLCFNCHEKAAFETPDADGTEFRNEALNLHYLHVSGREEDNKYGMKVSKKKEGMTCMGCHLTHGTEQAKLVRVNLECGPTYCYTMAYRKFEGGGTCVVGCRKPKVYRQEPQSTGDSGGSVARGEQKAESAAVPSP